MGGMMNASTLLIERYLKRQPIGNCRTAPRFDASAIPAFKSINQVDGPEVKLINISRRGALIASREPISPGPIISLQIITAESVHIVKGHIVRQNISSENNKEAPYQSVVAFEEDFPILPAGPDEDLTLYP